jgi:hypothetical protein
MKKRRAIWYFCLGVLFLASMAMAAHTHFVHVAHRRQLLDMADTVAENHDEWKDLKIDGQSPMQFNKDMYVTHSIAGYSFAATLVLLCLTVLFLAASVFFYRRRADRDRSTS